MADMERLRHDLSGELRVGVLYYAHQRVCAAVRQRLSKGPAADQSHLRSCQNYQVFELLKNGRIDIGIVARVRRGGGWLSLTTFRSSANI